MRIKKAYNSPINSHLTNECGLSTNGNLLPIEIESLFYTIHYDYQFHSIAFDRQISKEGKKNIINVENTRDIDRIKRGE